MNAEPKCNECRDTGVVAVFGGKSHPCKYGCMNAEQLLMLKIMGYKQPDGMLDTLWDDPDGEYIPTEDLPTFKSLDEIALVEEKIKDSIDAGLPVNVYRVPKSSHELIPSKLKRIESRPDGGWRVIWAMRRSSDIYINHPTELQARTAAVLKMIDVLEGER